MNKLVCILAAVVLMLAGCGGGSIGGITAITMNPEEASLLPNGTKQFSIVEDLFVDWSAPDGGTVNNGLFTAPNTPGSYHVVATSILNPLVSGTATVTVANVQVTITPQAASVAKGSVNTNLFTAVVVGTANKAVTWSLSSQSAGSISASTPDGNGNPRASFTAGTTPGTFQVRATSVAEPTVIGTALVTVMGGSTLAVNPKSASLTTTPPNNGVTFTAVLTDSAGAIDTTTALIWDIPSNPVGATLTGADLRQRVFTVPTNFVGNGNCTVRVRTLQGNSVTSFVQVHSGS
jgi:hypothetical protein